VRQEKDRVTISHGADSSSEIVTCAFFCDCEHTLLPVTSGHRLALVYNLVKTKKPVQALAAKGLPLPTAVQEFALKSAVQAWSADDLSPAKFVWGLDFKQTRSTLNFESLRPKDKQLVKMLCDLKDDSGLPLLSVHLALSEYRASQEYDKPEDRLIWGCLHVSTLRKVQGVDAFVSPCEVLVPDFFKHLTREDEDTGNEGVGSMFVYRDALVVFWPRSKTPQVLIESSLEEAAAYIVQDKDARVHTCTVLLEMLPKML
jgi:hypothetical protein